jgi:hypothetical protein
LVIDSITEGTHFHTIAAFAIVGEDTVFGKAVVTRRTVQLRKAKAASIMTINDSVHFIIIIVVEVGS